LAVSNLVGGETKIERRIERLYALDDPRFMHELGVLLGPPFLAGAKVCTLLNGDEIFAPMLAAIRGAQVSITFETYIYWSDDISCAFADALAEPARQGVKVHVLLDWVGSAKMDDSLMTGLSQAGVQGTRFHPPHGSHLGRLKNRTRRKLLIVDGLLTSVGSTNFDNRSFRLNDEATLNIVDRAFAGARTAVFEADLARARSVRHAEWQARPARERFGEWPASVIAAQP
jgi:cardiolipin synthase A/B